MDPVSLRQKFQKSVVRLRKILLCAMFDLKLSSTGTAIMWVWWATGSVCLCVCVQVLKWWYGCSVVIIRCLLCVWSVYGWEHLCVEISLYYSFCVNPNALHICVPPHPPTPPTLLTCTDRWATWLESHCTSLSLTLSLLFLLIHYLRSLLDTSLVNHRNVVLSFQGQQNACEFPIVVTM